MSNSLTTPINIFSDGCAHKTDSLHDFQLIRGHLSEIRPYVPGFFVAAIGKRQVVLPAELQYKLSQVVGCKIEVLRCDGEYTVRRCPERVDEEVS